MNFGEKKTTMFLLVFYGKKTMRRYFSPYCCCMMKMLRERIFDKKQYQPNFLGRNQRWLFAGRDTEAPESWDWGLGDIERCWLMSSGVLGCVYVYRCILHFDYQKHRISWIKVLKNLIMHYNTSKLGPRLCCWDGTLYRIKWDSFSLQTWVGLRDQAENGSSTGHPWWWWQRGMLLGSENVAKLFQRVMMQSNLRWSKDTHWTRQWFLSSQYSGAKLVWN